MRPPVLKPRLLDLFCGAGGCSVGYARAGFEVVGVDIAPQPNYPFEFFQMDAMDVAYGLQVDVLLGPIGKYEVGDFAAVHASPPCQHYSTLNAVNGKDHPDLIAELRKRLQGSGLPYAIENVVGAPLINPIQICGSGLNLDVRRHRLFECSFSAMGVPCAHGQQTPRFDVFEHGKWRKSSTVPVYGVGGGKAVEHWADAMGIDWMTRPELAEAIPPAYTEHIGSYLLEHVRPRAAA